MEGEGGGEGKESLEAAGGFLGFFFLSKSLSEEDVSPSLSSSSSARRSLLFVTFFVLLPFVGNPERRPLGFVTKSRLGADATSSQSVVKGKSLEPLGTTTFAAEEDEEEEEEEDAFVKTLPVNLPVVAPKGAGGLMVFFFGIARIDASTDGN